MREQDYNDEYDIQLVQQGQTEVFDRVVRRYTPILYSLCYRMLADHERAEDAVQEIFLKAYRSLSTFDPSRRFYSWIYTIAVNHLRSLNRKAVRRPQPDLAYEDDPREAVRMDGKYDEPDTTAVQREGERLAQEALNRIDRKYREVFVLRTVEGLSGKEAAEVLGIPENTVKTYLRRAREKMMKEMKKMGWE